MATVQQWGRKEAIIWPPRGYVYTLGAVSSRTFCRGRHRQRQVEHHSPDALPN